jgi:hypothetical protein
MDQKANWGDDGVMNLVLALLGLIALAATTARLVWLVMRDGLGTNPPPRSHREELGSWADQQLHR